jgi:hypothetical protein
MKTMETSMKTSTSILLAATLLSGVGSAQASSFTFTHDYGLGKFVPGGTDTLGSDFVEVSDQSTERFNDSFDLSGLIMDNSTVFELSLTYSDTDNRNVYGISPEEWAARVQGDDKSAGADDDDEIFVLDRVGSSDVTSVFTLDASDDVAPKNAFQTTLSNEKFEFWFADGISWIGGAGPNEFKLYSATLEVSGASVVPIPAAAWLFGSALVGMAGLGYRRSRQA